MVVGVFEDRDAELEELREYALAFVLVFWEQVSWEYVKMQFFADAFTVMWNLMIMGNGQVRLCFFVWSFFYRLVMRTRREV